MNDAFGHPQSVIVLGGTSEIAGALVDAFVAERCRTVVFAGRDAGGLRAAAERAKVEGADVVETVAFDATEVEEVSSTIARCFAAAEGPVDLVLVSVGLLGDAAHDVSDPARVDEVITINFTWPAAAAGVVAQRLRAQGYGRIVVLSSVAGVRTRAANFVYGAAKAGLDGFILGLAETLRGSGVSVHVVRPGFVHSKMTLGRRPAPFAVSPEEVAVTVLRGIERGQAVIWVPAALRWAFLVLRNLPQALWRRLPE